MAAVRFSLTSLTSLTGFRRTHLGFHLLHLPPLERTIVGRLKSLGGCKLVANREFGAGVDHLPCPVDLPQAIIGGIIAHRHIAALL